MSRHRWWYHEHLDGGEWHSEWLTEPRRRPRWIAFVPVSSPLVAVFEGPDAQLRLRQGRPSPSPLVDHWAHLDDSEIAWADAADLLVDLWDTVAELRHSDLASAVGRALARPADAHRFVVVTG